MTRLMFALALIACSGKSQTGTTTTGGGSGSDGRAIMAKKIALSWGITPTTVEGAAMADIYLATTDETGKQLSHQVGTYKGTCAKFSPAKEMNALTGVQCLTAGGGTELHAVQRVDEIVVVQMGTEPGKTPDPMAREEVTRVKIPTGIAVEVAP